MSLLPQSSSSPQDSGTVHRAGGGLISSTIFVLHIALCSLAGRTAMQEDVSGTILVLAARLAKESDSTGSASLSPSANAPW